MEEDHVPARTFFDGRGWPEGYNFPACANCNRETSQDEKVVAFLSRIRAANDGEQSPAQIAELQQPMAAIHRDHPEAYEAMRMPANDVRRFLREHGLTKPPNTTFSDFPVLSLARPEFIMPIKKFGIKLFCALHYKHTGVIVPPDWRIAVRLVTNVQASSADILSGELFQVLNGRPALQRSNNQLDDQFSYVFAIALEQTTAAFVCKFRDSFVLLGIVTNSALPAAFNENAEAGAFQGCPFRHAL